MNLVEKGWTNLRGKKRENMIAQQVIDQLIGLLARKTQTRLLSQKRKRRESRLAFDFGHFISFSLNVSSWPGIMFSKLW